MNRNAGALVSLSGLWLIVMGVVSLVAIISGALTIRNGGVGLGLSGIAGGIAVAVTSLILHQFFSTVADIAHSVASDEAQATPEPPKPTATTKSRPVASNDKLPWES